MDELSDGPEESELPFRSLRKPGACKQAVTDYRDKHGIAEEIKEIDGSEVFWRKRRGYHYFRAKVRIAGHWSPRSPIASDITDLPAH